MAGHALRLAITGFQLDHLVSGATGWHGKHLAMLVRCQQQKALWCEQSQAPQAASQHLQMVLEQGVHLQMALELALQRRWHCRWRWKHLQMALEAALRRRHLQMALELALQRRPLATLLRCQRQKALEQGVQ